MGLCHGKASLGRLQEILEDGQQARSPFYEQQHVDLDKLTVKVYSVPGGLKT